MTANHDDERAAHLKTILVPVDHIAKRELTSDAVWRAAARDRLRVLRVKQEELAEHVGTPAQSTISYVLAEADNSEDFRRSEYIERISVALGLPLPYLARVELAISPLIRAGSAQAIESLIAHVESLAPMLGAGTGVVGKTS